MPVLQWGAEARGGVQPAPTQGLRHERGERRQSDDLRKTRRDKGGRGQEVEGGGGSLCLIFPSVCQRKSDSHQKDSRGRSGGGGCGGITSLSLLRRSV